MGLMKTILKQYKLIRDPEAESIAMEALWRACEDFDESLGYKRSTLITIYIKRALGGYIRHLNRKRQLSVVSYNNIAYFDGYMDHEYLELLPADDNIEQQLIDKYVHTKVRAVYEQEVQKLEGTKRAIVETWEKADFCATNQAIADKVGISQPYVCHVLAVFKNCMRKILKEELND